MRNNNRLYCLLLLLLLQLAIRSGADKVDQSLTNRDEFAGVEAGATHIRRRLEEEEGDATGEAEAANNEEGEGGKEEGEGGDGNEAAKAEASGDGDSDSSDEDDKDSKKDESEKGDEEKDEPAADEGEKKDEESSSDEAADSNANQDEPAAAPEIDGAGEENVEATKDEALTDKKESSDDEEEAEDSYATLATPPSFYALEEYSIESITMTSCQKIDFAFAYLTSLEFDGSVVKNAKKKQDDSKFWSDIYIVEMVVLPTSLILAFFGSSLLMPASVLAAACFGTFLVFHFISGAFGGLDCKLKLGLSAVSAGACAALAMKFVRFGLFTLGAFSTGTASYLFFDSFPAFDPGQNFFDVQGLVSDASYISSVVKHSDISQAAWAIILVLALFTGICIRVYEQASVEFLTALLGGTGAGYSIHAMILVHGGSLNRSLVAVIAVIVGSLGWRFQRRRRIETSVPAKQKHLPTFNANPSSNGATWEQLQKSIDTTNAVLQTHGDDKTAAELAGLLNNFQHTVKERGKDN